VGPICTVELRKDRAESYDEVVFVTVRKPCVKDE
jgi:hypothetical protein